jgi:hypothetical protein
MGVATSGAVVALAATAPGPAASVERPGARLQGLDKITARTSTFELAVGRSTRMGTLSITLRACRESLPTDPPESAAFLEVAEIRQGEQTPSLVFSGWMFASSPALSAMEHPVYDVWVLSCKDK